MRHGRALRPPLPNWFRIAIVDILHLFAPMLCPLLDRLQMARLPPRGGILHSRREISLYDRARPGVKKRHLVQCASDRLIAV